MMRAPEEEFAAASLDTFRAAVSELEKAVRNIRAVWDGLIQAVQEMVAAVRGKLDASWWGAVVAWFSDDVKDVLKSIENILTEAGLKVAEILDRLERSVNGAVPVRSLFTVALDWSTKVNTTLSKIVPDVQQSGDIDSWHGPAHATYLIRENEQEKAADHVTEAVKEISLWLSEVGVANVDFIANLFAQAGQVIEKIVEVTADVTVVTTTADPLSAQETINDLAASLGRFASNITTYLGTLGSRLAEVVGMVTEIAAVHSDSRDFPGGDWPSAVKA
ncbi:MAG TPA: hypothetical protein VN408_25805 [Actinoplanes sp.]|nr:hypothetical protein [Actinoplanes sp.]